MMTGVQMQSARAHCFGYARKFFYSFTFLCQSDEPGGDLRVGCVFVEQGIEKPRCFCARKVFATHQASDILAQWILVHDHVAQVANLRKPIATYQVELHHSFKKFPSSRLPSAVMIDSG